MKIIDDKGKVFGIINIFDLVALMLIFVMLMPMVIFKYKNPGNIKKVEDVPNYRHLYKDIRARAFLINEVSGRIKKGDRSLDSSGNILWQITDIISDETATFDLAGKSDNGLVVIDAMKTSDYSVSNDEIAISLSSTSDFVGDKVKLPFLRRVTIVLKLLCSIERDDTVSLSPSKISNRYLRVGETIQLTNEGYVASFTITDIL